MSSQKKNTTTVTESWQRIETWLKEHAPDQASSLAKAATSDQLQKLETQLGILLPAEYRQSCAVHDGQKDECDLIPDGFGTFYLLRVKDIPREHRLWNSLSKSGEFAGRVAKSDKGVEPAWWKSEWIPFAANGGGDNLCLDLAPGPGGTIGQVIKIQHDNKARTLLARSFGGWLEQLADSLENGDLDDFLE